LTPTERRKIVSVAKSLGVDTTDSLALNLAKGFIGPLLDYEIKELIRLIKPMWYIYEKALSEIQDIRNV
jgi:hypothetical protein